MRRCCIKFDDTQASLPEKSEATPKTDSHKATEQTKDAVGEISSPSVTSTTPAVETPPSDSTPTTSAVVIGGLEFARSVEEARRRVSKKKDVKSTNMTAKDKYDIFQKLWRRSHSADKQSAIHQFIDTSPAQLMEFSLLSEVYAVFNNFNDKHKKTKIDEY